MSLSKQQCDMLRRLTYTHYRDRLGLQHGPIQRTYKSLLARKLIQESTRRSKIGLGRATVWVSLTAAGRKVYRKATEPRGLDNRDLCIGMYNDSFGAM